VIKKIDIHKIDIPKISAQKINMYSDKRGIQLIPFFACLLFLSLTTIHGFLFAQTYVGKKMVIIYPVVDMDTQLPSQEVQKQITASLPACPDTEKCFRAYQGLYNELATCSAEQGDYVQLVYENIVYGFCQNTKKPLNTFWTQKNNVIVLDSINDKKIEQAIPACLYAGKPTVVLIYPWKIFSVGTRFFHNSQQDKKDLYCIQYPDYKKKIVVTTYISKHYALKERSLTDESLIRLRFIKLINQLVDLVAKSSNDTKIIPYVWGGSSFIWPEQKDKSDFYKQDGVWRRHRNNKQKSKQYTGYDCSGFIMRMAKIAGVDFPWKTSWAIREKKRVLTKKDILKDGDIIWMPGHVMIVSNVKNNELIEARGYGSEFGCVHRIKVSEFFDGIDTYQNLVTAYHANKKIKYKNKNGIVGGKECEFKLLKLIG